MSKFYTTGDLARRWEKCRETINNYIKKGKLKPSLIIQGRAFFSEKEILEFEYKNETALPKIA
ncbi:MAG: hypothetical protein FD167_196 [bacterium]|nr:MAG: hypothetical protein FD167_196 [bacterium]